LDYPAKTPGQLGAILRGFRRSRGMTQAQLAARVGLTQKAVSLAETRPERIGVERLFRLVGALEVDLVLSDRRARTASLPSGKKRISQSTW
jgi:HTH-type transcriptional regulator/antitoxin HipB